MWKYFVAPVALFVIVYVVHCLEQIMIGNGYYIPAHKKWIGWIAFIGLFGFCLVSLSQCGAYVVDHAT